jgi:uncharacterized membrane protein
MKRLAYSSLVLYSLSAQLVQSSAATLVMGSVWALFSLTES